MIKDKDVSLKLREELAAKAALLDAQLEQIEELQGNLKRAYTACVELDAEVEAHAHRMERVAVVAAMITFVVGIAFGMMF